MKDGFHFEIKNDLLLLRCDAFEAAGIKALFTTRLGGVSQSEANRSLNLSFLREELVTVAKNYDIVCRAADLERRRLTYTDQVHDTRIALIDDGNAGQIIERTDGLMTACPDTPLSVVVADCLPVLIADPVQKVCAAVHSGRKGTLGGIAPKAVGEMTARFGSDPKDILVAVGPAICGSCYEVGAEVKDGTDPFFAPFFTPKENGKYLLDLPLACKASLENAGVEQVFVSSHCTMEEPGLFYSHRYTHGRRGNFAGIISL